MKTELVAQEKKRAQDMKQEEQAFESELNDMEGEFK